MERGTEPGETAEPSGPRREVAPSWKGAPPGSGSYKEGPRSRRGRALGAHPFPGVPRTQPQVQQVAPPGAPLRRVRQPFSRSSGTSGGGSSPTPGPAARAPLPAGPPPRTPALPPAPPSAPEAPPGAAPSPRDRPRPGRARTPPAARERAAAPTGAAASPPAAARGCPSARTVPAPGSGGRRPGPAGCGWSGRPVLRRAGGGAAPLLLRRRPSPAPPAPPGLPVCRAGSRHRRPPAPRHRPPPAPRPLIGRRLQAPSAPPRHWARAPSVPPPRGAPGSAGARFPGPAARESGESRRASDVFPRAAERGAAAGRPRRRCRLPGPAPREGRRLPPRTRFPSGCDKLKPRVRPLAPSRPCPALQPPELGETRRPAHGSPRRRSPSVAGREDTAGRGSCAGTCPKTRQNRRRGRSQPSRPPHCVQKGTAGGARSGCVRPGRALPDCPGRSPAACGPRRSPPAAQAVPHCVPAWEGDVPGPPRRCPYVFGPGRAPRDDPGREPLPPELG
ncbi:basic proline-rich protein-like [Enhydra lutris kenyoni]|uniref:Basic proline-rich protein-like n=1 Tax=Enhydra lutris kenyoni TaxID=391180 RepID=A0A2Y9LCY0_ENHLU|nr:basic proline-rich protein-like [Enhydra lutris kenyoni]